MHSGILHPIICLQLRCFPGCVYAVTDAISLRFCDPGSRTVIVSLFCIKTMRLNHLKHGGYESKNTNRRTDGLTDSPDGAVTPESSSRWNQCITLLVVTGTLVGGHTVGARVVEVGAVCTVTARHVGLCSTRIPASTSHQLDVIARPHWIGRVRPHLSTAALEPGHFCATSSQQPTGSAMTLSSPASVAGTIFISAEQEQTKTDI